MIEELLKDEKNMLEVEMMESLEKKRKVVTEEKEQKYATKMMELSSIP